MDKGVECLIALLVRIYLLWNPNVPHPFYSSLLSSPSLYRPTCTEAHIRDKKG